MKILILGGNRFVGKRLATQLMLRGHDVSVMNRSGTGPDNCHLLTHDRNLDFWVAGEYDVVVDFCLFKEEQAESIVRTLYNKCGKYIFISSGAVYKDSECLLYNEDMPTGGRTAFGNYGVEKSQCEDIVKSSNLNYIILRPPYIIGDKDYHRPRISYYVQRILNNKPVEVAGNGDKVLSFIWIDDLVDVLLYVVEGFGRESIYNVVSQDYYTSRSLVYEISSFLGKEIDILCDGTNAPFINEDLMLSPLKLARKFPTFRQNLLKFMNWYEQNTKS